MSKVFLRDRQTPFHAEEVEFLAKGWLRAKGRWPHWGENEEGEIVASLGQRHELIFPPSRVRLIHDDD